MVVQIITYDTANPVTEDYSGIITEMEKYYLGNGCSKYEIYRDSNDPKRFFELAYFETMDAAADFDKIDTLEKNELFKKFCSTSQVIGESVEVKILEKI